MRSFWITWVGPNPMMSVFRRESQREKFETDTEEEAAWLQRLRLEWCGHKLKRPRRHWRCGKDFPMETPERAALPIPWCQTLAFRTMKEYISDILSLLVFGSLLGSSWEADSGRKSHTSATQEIVVVKDRWVPQVYQLKIKGPLNQWISDFCWEQFRKVTGDVRERGRREQRFRKKEGNLGGGFAEHEEREGRKQTNTQQNFWERTACLGPAARAGFPWSEPGWGTLQKERAKKSILVEGATKDLQVGGQATKGNRMRSKKDNQE